MRASRCLLLAAAAAASAASASPSLTDVFVSGEEGYACYRIPAVILLPSPTTTTGAGPSLLAFAEGRKFTCADHGWNDIVTKLSTDGGKTWGPLAVAYGESSRAKNVTIGNPAPVVDTVHLGPTGQARILLPFSRNNIEAGVLVSLDMGVTWSMLAPALPVPASWVWVATGPPGGLQLLPSGRILVPSDHQISGKPYYAHTYISDDGGKTWSISATSLADGNECQAVQMPWVNSSTVLLTTRTTLTYRAAALSVDGGSTFGPMYPVFNETACEGSVASLPEFPGGPLLVMSSAFDVSSRANMTLHTSSDNGRTWVPAVNVYAGYAAYSSLVNLGTTQGDSVGLLFERDNYEKISYAAVQVPS